MKILITGANGFIGEQLCKTLTDSNHTVIRLVRHPKTAHDIAFDLKNPAIPNDALSGADMLVHLAYTTRFRTQKEARRVNIGGSLWLFEMCKQRNIPVLFLSSLAAHEDALSFYGRSKFFLEGELDEARDIIIRPGLVVGKGGVFERMLGMLKTIKGAPVFWGGKQPLQTVYIDDLIHQIVFAITNKLSGIFVVAEEKPHTMLDFYHMLFAHLKQRPMMLALPGTFMLYAAKFWESLGVTLPISSENLLGLKAMKKHSVVLPDPATPIRPLSESLSAGIR